MRQPHAAQHVRRLRELDIVVPDDLDAVAPRIEKIEKRTRQRFDAGIGQRFADGGLLVIDHKSKMAAVVGGLSTALLERKELVAQIDEGRCLALAAKLEVEQATIEGQSLFDVTNFDSDMVETDGTRFLCFRHKASQSF